MEEYLDFSIDTPALDEFINPFYHRTSDTDENLNLPLKLNDQEKNWNSKYYYGSSVADSSSLKSGFMSDDFRSFTSNKIVTSASGRSVDSNLDSSVCRDPIMFTHPPVSDCAKIRMTNDNSRSLQKQPPSFLPTPPVSPCQDDLESIINAYPEILDYPASVLFPGVADVLHDLEFNFSSHFGESSSNPKFEAFPCNTSQLNHTAKNNLEAATAVKIEQPCNSGAWSVASDLGLQEDIFMRLPTELTSQSYNSSDEEIEHFPETPAGSDLEGSRSPYECNYGTPSPPPLSHTQAKFITDYEHNYCETEFSRRNQIPPQFDTDDEVDVVSCKARAPKPGRPPLRASSQSQAPSTFTVPSSSSSSAQVKRQLQLAINGKNKQKGRVGRPPKAATVISRQSKNASNSLLTQGKPAAYTKRMREEHSVAQKPVKKRKTAAGDPDDDQAKRDNHNKMERTRRCDLRNVLEKLRDKIPEIMLNQRVSKALILNKAQTYISQLKMRDVDLLAEKVQLLSRQQRLKTRLKLMEKGLTVLEEDKNRYGFEGFDKFDKFDEPLIRRWYTKRLQ